MSHIHFDQLLAVFVAQVHVVSVLVPRPDGEVALGVLAAIPLAEAPVLARLRDGHFLGLVDGIWTTVVRGARLRVGIAGGTPAMPTKS